MYANKLLFGFYELQRLEEAQIQSFIDDVAARMPAFVKKSPIIFAPCATPKEMYQYLLRHGPKRPQDGPTMVGPRPPSPTLSGRVVTSSDSDDAMNAEEREGARREREQRVAERGERVCRKGLGCAKCCWKCVHKRRKIT
jgi:hypothetical protein